MLTWPDRHAVITALDQWAAATARRHPEVARIGYAGSYARGNWGVGSDVDIVILLRESTLPFERRGTAFDATDLPVPADLLVYTVAEWDELTRQGRTITREAVWIHDEPEQSPIERWVATWREAQPALEAQKRAELEQLATPRALAELAAAFEHARRRAPLSDTSGLVEQQRYFQLLRR